MDVELTINRIYQNDCTVGIMRHAKGFRCCTLELPWLNNQKSISCVPEGLYWCYKRHSSKNGHVFELENVINRSSIQCHPGNFTRQIEGCILLGAGIKDIDKDGILDVTDSVATLKALLRLLPYRFVLEIRS